MIADHQTPKEFLTDFLLSRIAERPAAERILLYRALAAETNDRLVADACRELAGRLEAIEHAHEQLLLNLRATALSTKATP